MIGEHRSFQASVAAVSALAVAGALALAGSKSADAAVGCDRVAAPGGSDSAAGTEAAPLRTAQRLLDSLDPGEVGCLRAGTFSADQFRVKTPDVTLRSYPGERATLRGQLRFQPTADRAIVQNLTLDGRNRQGLASPLIFADGAVVRGNDISNAHGDSSCVLVSRYYDNPAPRGVVIDQNRIHDCGALPATNHHHGIYLSAARSTMIRDNWIYGNADRGVQLYPDADGTTVTGNVIDGNGQGIIFGSNDESSPDDNVVVGNVVTNSTIRYNVESHSQGAPYGQGNVVRRNCIHGGARDDGNGGIESPQKGFTATDNVTADPRYVDRRTGDFRLQPDSPCLSVFSGSGGVVASGGSDRPAAGDRQVLRLRANKGTARRGSHVRLRGRAVLDSPTVRIVRRRAPGSWKLVARLRVKDERFVTRARINRRRVNRFGARAAGDVRSDVVKVHVRGRR